MNEHIFMISTMNPELTSQVFLNILNTSLNYSIQKFKYNNKQVWIACMSPVLQCMAENIIQYNDKCVILYHKHDALSCLRVANTVKFISRYNANIELASVSLPVLPSVKCLVKKQYNNDGLLRKFLTGTIKDIIHKI